ncbi:MAG: hypothetical protein ACHQO8_03395 [Vicinamibacterales bacterium]
MRRLARAWLGLIAIQMMATRLLAAEPIVSVWYRGSPPGQPRQDDLAVIRALGFGSVTWPSVSTGGAGDLRRMADIVGVAVQIRPEPQPLTPASALRPRPIVDVSTMDLAAQDMPALVWRAVAHGARVICFDPGPTDGTGLQNAAGRQAPWVGAARSIARQLAFNAKLFNEIRSGPVVNVLGPAAPVLDVVLMQDERSWVLFATNASRARVKAVARLPAIVPAAMWVNMLDGAQMSMLSQPIGPRWDLDLEPGGARVYVISKTEK